MQLAGTFARSLVSFPDTDGEGDAIQLQVFASRWRHDPHGLLKHLIKKHEGELIEVEGYWIQGIGPVPDQLFHPQFASILEDYAT